MICDRDQTIIMLAEVFYYNYHHCYLVIFLISRLDLQENINIDIILAGEKTYCT